MIDEMLRALTKFEDEELTQMFALTINTFLRYRDEYKNDDAKALALTSEELIDIIRAIVEEDAFFGFNQ